MNKVKEFVGRKFLGLKVLYWIALFVLVAAIYAWKLAPKEAAADDVTPAGDAAGLNAVDVNAAYGVAPPEFGYPTLQGGTVVVAPGAPIVEDVTEADNEAWFSRAVGVLQKRGVSSTAAQQALTKYLEGSQLSIVERGQVELVIQDVGLPPAPSYAGQATYVDVLDKVSPGVANAIKYVSLAGNPNDRWVFRDDNTLQYMTQAEWVGLGYPYVKPLPATHVVWTYPVTRPKPGAI